MSRARTAPEIPSKGQGRGQNIGDDEDCCTVASFADGVGVSERTVRRDIAAGRLPVHRVHARRLYVRYEDPAAQQYRAPISPWDRVTAEEFARCLGISLRTLRTWIRTNARMTTPNGTTTTLDKLTWYSSPRRLYFSREDLQELGLIARRPIRKSDPA